MPPIEGDCALVVIHFPKRGRVPFKGWVATTRQGGSYSPQLRFWIASGLLTMRSELAGPWAHGCQNDVFIEVSYEGRRQGPANVDGVLREPTI